ncbi:uncharacterized protein [Eurosta solidaginis]|uniref:uncharacterized protein n=1 Tax=Eurosta solidaginis TaxID=178769 RepID=UPI0035313A84
MDMTDKNAGHNGTQWTKASATAAAAVIAAHQQQQQQQKHNTSPLSATSQLHQHHQQQQHRLYDPTTLMPAHSSIFRGTGVAATLGHPAHPDGIAAYAGARFHPPPLPIQQSTIDATHMSHTMTAHQHTQHHLHQHQAPPTHAPTTVLTAPAASSPSVPVQSGFVPPPLLPGAVTPQLEHLTSHLNLQQQFELNKIMNAMSTHPNEAASLAGGTGGVATAPAGGNSVSSLINQQQQQRMINTDVPMTSAAGSNISSSSGVISSNIAENVLNALGATPNSSVSANVPAVHGRLAGMGVRLPDDERLRNLQKVVESGISESSKEQIQQIVDRVATLKPVEKLLLYLRLPGETPETDPLRHPQNPLGTRSEINHTINWVRTHLEHDPKVSIPKQDVYNDYIAYCDRLDIKPLSTADFGKVMKQVFPGVRPRRLGTRGHSRYCYAAMRKTTKLDAPQLPLLNTAAANESAPLISTSDTSSAGAADTETWKIICNWAETVLNMKADSAQDLASRIKSTTSEAITSNMRAGGVTTPHKKYTPREPKEKRVMVDMGPLKKRRKKRRKGSSSSESSCIQLQPQTQAASSAQIDTLAVDIKPNLNDALVQIKQEFLESPTLQRAQHLPVTATQPPQVNTMTEGFLQQQQQQQMLPMNLVTEQRTVLARAPPAASAFGVVQPQPPPTQQGAIQGRATLMGANTSTTTTAVKNLTPKIIELGAAAATASPTMSVHESTTTIKEEEFSDDYNPNIFCKKVRKAQQTKGFWANSPTSVPSNIVVPTIITSAATSEVAVSASSTSSSLSAVATSVIATNVSQLDTGAVATSDLMGPPAQIGSSSTSVSPSSALLGPESGATTTSTHSHPTSASPKVLSRNMLQMRARRQQIAAALAAEAAANAGNSLSDADAGDLPANLGLPRERVISICNMDKHELDDYFVDGEVEEEPEDQDTELLQYFQTRDAEEKFNTSDAIKMNRHSTATTTSTPAQAMLATEPASTTITPICSITTTTTQVPAVRTASLIEKPPVQRTPKEAGSRQQPRAQIVPTESYSYAIAASSSKHMEIGVPAPKTNATTTTTAVGSASASLTLMSQKHQQAHQQNAHQQQLLIAQMRKTGNTFTNNNKRKITLSGTTVNAAEVIATRKNCIFFPISPNGSGNNTTSSASSGDDNKSLNKNLAPNNNNKFKKGDTPPTHAGSASNCNSGSFFVSPGQSVHRVRPKPAYALTKQLSLDQDSSDPMIGASRRRRSYANLVISGGSNSLMPLTSASAPPSPSILQQQQQKQQYQQIYGASFLSSDLNIGQQTTNPGAACTALYNQSNNSSAVNATDLLAAEQNSLDLDMFSAAAARAMDYDELALDELTTPLSEMQRSQSVPLSQLQRVHSPAFNRSFQAAPYSACTSVAQTPLSHEYGDSSALFSENSCSQNSGGLNGKHNTQTVAAKLLDDEAALLATDTAAMLDNLDVGEMFTTEFLRMKFPSNTHGNTITATTCSSAGSSSGYSSSACTTFGSSALISGGSGTGNGNTLSGGTGNTMSRSVPSTPLPHQQQQSPFASYFYGSRRRLKGEAHLSPSFAMSGNAAMGGTFTTTVFKYNNHGGGGTIGVNNSYDISRSMPTTPTATPRFRYSPTEFTREFLSNGNTNTIDSLISGGANTNSLTDAGAPSEGLSDVLTGLTGNNDALIDESCCLSADAFGNHSPITEAEANELLGSL